MVRTHARSHCQCQTLAGDAGPVTGGGELRVSNMAMLQDKGKLGKLGKFHVQVLYVSYMPTQADSFPYALADISLVLTHFP